MLSYFCGIEPEVDRDGSKAEGLLRANGPMIALIRPYGERFFCQEVRELIPGTMEAKWFDYASFQPLPQIYPATSDKLKAFGVAVDKLGSLWDEQKGLP